MGRTRNRVGQEDVGPSLVDDVAVFRAKEGSTDTSPLLFGVQSVRWPTAAKQAGKWYRGMVKAADSFMARWHRAKMEKSWLRHANEGTNKKGEGGGGGQQTDASVHKSGKKLADRVLSSKAPM